MALEHGGVLSAVKCLHGLCYAIRSLPIVDGMHTPLGRVEDILPRSRREEQDVGRAILDDSEKSESSLGPVMPIRFLGAGKR